MKWCIWNTTFTRFFAACHPEFISGSPWLYAHALPHTCCHAEINHQWQFYNLFLLYDLHLRKRKSFPQSFTEFFTEFTEEYCYVWLCEHTLCNPVGGILPTTYSGNPLLQVLAMSLLAFLKFLINPSAWQRPHLQIRIQCSGKLSEIRIISSAAVIHRR